MRSGNCDKEGIMRDQGICGRRACIPRYARDVVNCSRQLGEGDSPEQILVDFPSLKSEDVKAALAFAAASAERICRSRRCRNFNERGAAHTGDISSLPGFSLQWQSFSPHEEIFLCRFASPTPSRTKTGRAGGPRSAPLWPTAVWSWSPTAYPGLIPHPGEPFRFTLVTV